jgi:predicted nucleotidyltransferase
MKTAPNLDWVYHHREQILQIIQAYHLENLRIFGSVARGEAHADSDIDFLADFPPHFTLVDWAGVVQDLQNLLGYRVQVTSAAHLREELRPYILQDVQAL